MFNITGTIKVISPEQQVSEKFKKREFVITDNSSQYPQHLTFQLTQDKCSLMNNYKEGDEVKVYFNLRGREWKTREGELKYFNSLEAWKVEGGTGSSSGSSSQSESATFINSADNDDLPF